MLTRKLKNPHLQYESGWNVFAGCGWFAEHEHLWLANSKLWLTAWNITTAEVWGSSWILHTLVNVGPITMKLFLPGPENWSVQTNKKEKYEEFGGERFSDRITRWNQPAEIQ